MSRRRRQLLLHRQWKKVFHEIKLAAPTSFNETIVPGSNNLGKIRRFEGFENWERRLQKWADDVEVYLDQNIGAEVYPFSSYGVPKTQKRKSTVTKNPTPSANVEPREDTQQLDGTRVHGKLKGEYPDDGSSFKPMAVQQGEAVVPHTDLADPGKHVWIVTTAALPWMTGTAVNPLLRSAYLCDTHDKVTIMLPWLERSKDQEKLYGQSDRFKSEEDQDQFIRNWLRNVAGMPRAADNLNIMWYIAWQETLENSVYSMGDITALIPDNEADICVLEEPEHLNWYRAPGDSWTKKFKHVVGIVHTNYFVYAQEQPAALIRAPAMKLLCSWMCRAHCHRVIKLSATLDKFAPEKELVENVHGVRRAFLDVGKELSCSLTSSRHKLIFSSNAKPTLYFIGKMLWSKGIGSLMELMKYAEESADLQVSVDMFGNGPNMDEAKERAENLGLDMTFHGAIDHIELGWSHKIFINPSTSEVLCTTAAEALAMGKFVILPSHPSNDFFTQFPNCLPYSSKEEFVGNLYYALSHSPKPMTADASRILSWEAATERFIAAASISVFEAETWNKTLSAETAGIDINLPPLIKNEERLRELTRPFHRTRNRYRQFRSRLAVEVRRSKVLPLPLQEKVLEELDKRLDIDLDQILSEPKLRLALSPAELDKRLLDFYDNFSKGPGGDLLRIIGGGANVGAQNLYLKRQARKINEGRESGSRSSLSSNSLITSTGTNDLECEGSPVATVKKALERNLRLAPKRSPYKPTTEKEPDSGIIGSQTKGLRAQYSAKTTVDYSRRCAVKGWHCGRAMMPRTSQFLRSRSVKTSPVI
eukprot:CAMPEP_0196806770 /NCGR_PEP_ID=MMETSP1362-20130617/6685_1 /TAXON_ID=163516 /ORGANISM="Leptocylindrus danicus, Strain CCMP1856" /LENGTH=816 /DNA_ID=CAMNT_0042180399 /DNA_START=235 /DNA_END=2685 /DNA_ORIENTATION=+